ncbi:hypothetical protein [Photorhabdus africana]|uniref:hypothetical protein n=1 Tax=Photorhabdus africana TaxID=3097554 RepID=UPI002B412FF0|nr:hypothetical protein [Photorhabdus sp. CRI-LC]
MTNFIFESFSLDIHQESEDILIGGIAYNDFNFIDKEAIKTGKQTKGYAAELRFFLTHLAIPYGLQDGSRRQGSESPGA